MITKEQNREKEEGVTRATVTNAEYFSALEKWVQEAYMWQCMNAWFPYIVLSQHAAIQGATANANHCSSETHFTAFSPAQHVQQNARLPQQVGRQQTPSVPLLGVEYVIPPLWKRFVAEFLDFLILFTLKLVITLMAVDVFELIDLDKYDLDVLQSNSKMDYQMALEMTTEILLLEVVHRVMVCLYEGFSLYQGSDGLAGGATPGKNTMGLRVVRCDRVISGPTPNTVLVYPATDLGLPKAIFRSIIKNMILAFLFPICFSMFFFQHNRSAYDVLCKTIVVEDPQQSRMLQQQIRVAPQQPQAGPQAPLLVPGVGH